jgi:hypothetical protein
MIPFEVNGCCGVAQRVLGAKNWGKGVIICFMRGRGVMRRRKLKLRCARAAIWPYAEDNQLGDGEPPRSSGTTHRQTRLSIISSVCPRLSQSSSLA